MDPDRSKLSRCVEDTKDALGCLGGAVLFQGIIVGLLLLAGLVLGMLPEGLACLLGGGLALFILWAMSSDSHVPDGRA